MLFEDTKKIINKELGSLVSNLFENAAQKFTDAEDGEFYQDAVGEALVSYTARYVAELSTSLPEDLGNTLNNFTMDFVEHYEKAAPSSLLAGERLSGGKNETI